MATIKEIKATYDYMDELLRLSLGAHGDYTGAMFNGDFSLTLDEAQAAKHKYILTGINFRPGDRVLDIGSGWGPILKAVVDADGNAVGLTLSPAQANWCQRSGLDARLTDWKDAQQADLGNFAAVVSVGAFEHFCSVPEYLAGQQNQIYRDFFSFCASILPPNGRLYLQTMIWGKQVPSHESISVKAPKHSDEWVLGLVEKFFPGSWLPVNIDQIIQAARPHFELVSQNNGRLDYIETLKRWGQEFYKPSIKKLWPLLKWGPRLLLNKNFRYQLMCLYYSSVSEVFKREIFTHQRMIFAKTKR